MKNQLENTVGKVGVGFLAMAVNNIELTNQYIPSLLVYHPEKAGIMFIVGMISSAESENKLTSLVVS